MTPDLLKYLFAGALLALPLERALALGDVHGEVEVFLEISRGCQVSNGGTSGGTHDFGELNFGRVSPTWNTVLSAQLISPQGDALQVTCDPNIRAFNVAIDGGLQGNRTLKLNTGTESVAYNLYQDAQHAREYVINEFVSFPIDTGGAPVNIPIHGAIPPSDTAKPSGVYQDTLTVTLNF